MLAFYLCSTTSPVIRGIQLGLSQTWIFFAGGCTYYSTSTSYGGYLGANNHTAPCRSDNNLTVTKR